MASESCSPPPGKRSRDPEDEVYQDNLHCHKRYLSEIMACSLNGLTVGDTVPENVMDSPARSDTTWCSREEVCSQCSPMSEDSDDSRSSDISCQIDNFSGQSSPASPHRYQKPITSFLSASPSTSYTLVGCVNVGACSLPRQRGSDSEARFPSSPSDICYPADLRRAALLRSVQMRVHPGTHSPFELPYCSMQEQESIHNVEPGEDVNNLGQGEFPLPVSDMLQDFTAKRDAIQGDVPGMNGLGNPFLEKRSVLGTKPATNE